MPPLQGREPPLLWRRPALFQRRPALFQRELALFQRRPPLLWIRLALYPISRGLQRNVPRFFQSGLVWQPRRHGNEHGSRRRFRACHLVVVNEPKTRRDKKCP